MAVPRICSVEGCDKRHKGLGYCRLHLERFRKHGSTDKNWPINQGKKCSVETCDKPALKRGWCQAHYERWLAHGDPRMGRVPSGEPQRYFLEVVLPYQGNDCLIWPYNRNGRGYGQVQIRGHKSKQVHRIACEIINGPPPSPDHHAAHLCGKGHLGCCTPSHTAWKTAIENQADRVLHGTHNRGERHPLAKLSMKDVERIRSLQGEMSQRHIAELFGVSQSMVSRIHKGKNWKHD